MDRKRYALSLLLVLILMFSLAMPAFATEEPIIITHQPQNLTYPQESVAIYSVEAVGENLEYTWYIVLNGKVFDTSKAIFAGEQQEWMDYVYGDFGRNETGNSFYMNGIQSGITGAEIYCEITDDKGNSITSDKAVISVSAFGSGMPPTITVLSAMTVKKGTALDLYCGAEAFDGSALAYLWYETQSGSLEDIVAIDRGAETKDYLHCDTSKAGTRYFVCMVTTASGGRGYSSVITVNIIEKDAENASETNTSETNTLETNTPETNAPETNIPETNTSETSKPAPDDSSEPSLTNNPDTAPKTDKPDSTSLPDTMPIDKVSDKNESFSWWTIVLPAVCIVAIASGVIFAVKKKKTDKDGETNK